MRNQLTEKALLQYYFAGYFSWGVCSLWYDLGELGFLPKYSGIKNYSDKLAHILLGIFLDAGDVLGITITRSPDRQRTIEDHLGMLLEPWIGVLKIRAQHIVDNSIHDDFKFCIEYLYHGFLSQIAHEFNDFAGDLTPKIGNLALDHKGKFPPILRTAEQIDIELKKVERLLGFSSEKVETLRNRRFDCSKELQIAWQRSVIEASLTL